MGNKRYEGKEVTKVWEENCSVGNENVTVISRGIEDRIMGQKEKQDKLFTK